MINNNSNSNSINDEIHPFDRSETSAASSTPHYADILHKAQLPGDSTTVESQYYDYGHGGGEPPIPYNGEPYDELNEHESTQQYYSRRDSDETPQIKGDGGLLGGDESSYYNTGQHQSSNYSVSGGGGSSSVRSSLRSRAPQHSGGGNNNTSCSNSGPTYFQPRVHTISQSGNPLIHVQISENEDLNLDKNEMKQLAKGGGSSSSSEGRMENEYMKHIIKSTDESTIDTSYSARQSLKNNNKNHKNNNNGTQIVEGDPNQAILLNNNNNEKPITDIDKKRAKMKELLFSPPFRRSLFLGVCFVLLVISVLLVIENFVRVKRYEDWIEPHRDDKLLTTAAGYGGGGVNWSFGGDAPQPQSNPNINDSIESNIRDWAEGTVRIPNGDGYGIDEYGSIALPQDVLVDDTPVFWTLPYTGGSIMETVGAQCFKFVQASNKGMDTEKDRNNDDDELNVLSTVYVMGEKYLNVNLFTPGGIEHARVMELGTSGMADIAYSSLLQEVSEVFSPTNQARLFMTVRHPVEREFAKFRTMKKSKNSILSTHEKNTMSYKMFAYSDHLSDNWMTRTLVQKDEYEPLTANDMHTSKEILRRKAVIGLYDDMNAAVLHFARYFGWDHALLGGQLNEVMVSCIDNAISVGIEKDIYGAFDLVEEDAKEGSVAWQRILDKNKFDLELFLYSQHLYRYQIALS